MFSKLTLYTSTQCVQCNGVRRYLAAKGVEYTERDFEAISSRIENELILGAKSKPILMHELGSTVEFAGGFVPEVIDRFVVAHLAAQEDE